MKVKDLIEALSQCNPEADFEVRASTEDGYNVWDDEMGIDDLGEVVVLDL